MTSTSNTIAPRAEQSWNPALRLLSASSSIQAPSVVAGFDGFVDTILHVVSERRSPTEYSRLTTIKGFSEKVLAASGGRNMNIEMLPRLTKIGGNGPIFANALAHFNIPVSYIGCLGSPAIHPVFDEFARNVKTYSIAEPGYSDAIEFTDGKLVCGKQQSVSEISWQSVLNRLTIDELSDLVSHAGLIAFLNWGILFSMTDMMDAFLRQIADHLSGPRKTFFIDTADPARRSEEDIERFVKMLSRLVEKFQVYLGFNLRESTFIARAVGLAAPQNTPDEVLTYSKRLRERLGIDAVVIHWSRHAVGNDSDSDVSVEAPFTDNPRISTGAGDHFNAGFCLGRLLGGDLKANIQLGVATSGYYVREGHGPTQSQLSAFIEGLS
jgi:sugar/nucleoside kinase (ribokinase family)